MAILSSINSETIQTAELSTGSSDLVLQIPLISGETVSFTAQSQFFVSRQLATNSPEALALPSQSVIEYTANYVPVVKLPIGSVDVTSPQLYPISIVSDVYQQIPIDNFFQELTDDLEVPDDDELQSLRDRRDAAMQAALALDDLAAATSAGDPDAIEEANLAIDEGLASAIVDSEPDPASVLTPEEADELGALDLVGLTDDFGTTDGAEDIIDPTPEILEEDTITKLPRLPGNKKVEGIDTINKAIDLLNSGIQAVEASNQSGVDEDGNCKFITVAKGKRGIAGTGIGKKKERKVSRAETEKRLNLVKEDIELQKSSATTIVNTKSGVRTYVPIVKSTTFGKLVGGVFKSGFLGAIAGIVLAPVTGGASLALTAAGIGVSTVGTAATLAAGGLLGARQSVPKGTKPMTKPQALKVLETVAKNLQNILDKPCN